jgi:hypothetical protein
MLQFVQVGFQVLHADLVVSADDAALEKAPDALNAVRVDIPAHPFFLRVINALVPRVFVGNADVGGELVGVDRFGIGRGMLMDEGVECFLIRPLEDCVGLDNWNAIK